MSKNNTCQDLTRRLASRRRAALRCARKTQRVDAILFTKDSDIKYFTGLSEGSQLSFVCDKWHGLMTYPMFEEVAPREAPGIDIIVEKGDGMAQIASQLEKHGVKKIGITPSNISLSLYRLLTQKFPNIEWVEQGDFAADIRAVKDEDELGEMRKAVRIAERAFSAMLRQGKSHFVGRSERQVAWELESRMIEMGALKQSFDSGIIVGSGAKHSASCHHVPTNRKLREGEHVLVDWGAQLPSGYCSDQTRVFFLGEPRAALADMYSTVKHAYESSVAQVKSGVCCDKVHRIAQEIIEHTGEPLRHSLGHGIGLDLHETPGLSPRVTTRLRSNMLVTVEPGIYNSRIGGIRLENTVLVTRNGYESLNKLSMNIKSFVLK